MKTVAIVLIMIFVSLICCAGEPHDPRKMDQKLINALVAFISEVVEILESVLLEDINWQLRDQVEKSIVECRKILDALDAK